MFKFCVSDSKLEYEYKKGFQTFFPFDVFVNISIACVLTPLEEEKNMSINLSLAFYPIRETNVLLEKYIYSSYYLRGCAWNKKATNTTTSHNFICCLGKQKIKIVGIKKEYQILKACEV